ANTHAAYVEARYGLQVRELERAMLEVKRIENWSDLAVWISEDGATKKRRKNTKIRPPGTTAHVSVIIPELTVIFAASYSTFRLSMFLPRVSFEIERQLRISQFFTDRLPESLALPRHSRQVEALTASTAALSYSYEQLEVLGDSFLKYYSSLDTLLVGAGWSEGRLSSHRQQSLSNAVLRKAAEKLHLTTYASFTPFFSKLWCPPPVLEARNRSALDRNVNRVLFGASERWRLLSLVEGKQVDKHQIYLLDLHTRLLNVDQDYRTKEQAKNSTDALFKYGQLIPPKALADMIEALIAIYYIDAGPRAALQFLNFCGILKADETRIMGMERFADPLALILGSNAWDTLKLEQQEKLKRRKLTPITEIILNNSSALTEEPS
ncbi:hypothetical protein EBZ37_14155, partial [bacterium]|nr:hypothetical protein [bacterium]